MADKVVPNSLNYSDIKPESIETDIKLVKYTPTATITGAKGGDMIKFLLTGQGFFDPYSSYFQFTVECNDLGLGEIRTLDRSAHSFIQRMIIRSQGVELERIENYDMIAAMINDMIYSPEQNAVHSWEGFPTHTVSYLHPRSSSGISRNPGDSREAGGVVAANLCPFVPERRMLAQLHSQGASPFEYRYVGECMFKRNLDFNNTQDGMSLMDLATNPKNPLDTVYLNDYRWIADATAAGLAGIDTGIPQNFLPDNYSLIPVDFAYHQQGRRNPGIQAAAYDLPGLESTGTTKMTFIIPIYSGVMGVLMPDKKLLPLGLLPLDIEIYFNPHALYSNLGAGSRNYTITDFNIYSHVIYFESDIHRQLEAQTAEHGLFIYCNSFHTAPQQLISGYNVPKTSFISVNLKSINSVHFLFVYNQFETSPLARKLHFVSHNITQMQLKNGSQIIPQYAIMGNAGTSKDNSHVPFIVELMKAWNKLHDPKTDGAIQAYNYCGDQYGCQFDAAYGVTNLVDAATAQKQLYTVLNKQGNVGRCQYGISLEGEELGTDKQMITGRKSEYPFLLELSSSGKVSPATSYMMTFLRADFIVYIRPDLQIVTLGK